MKKLLFILTLSILSFSPGYSSQMISTSTDQPIVVEKGAIKHFLKKDIKQKKREWKDREAHPNTKATNRIAYLSFWTGLGAFLLIALGIAVPALLAALISAPLGLLAWHRRPSKTLAQVASVLGIALGFGFMLLVIMAFIALIGWALGWW